ncbi:MAG: DUF1801 domain-containing protein [SAR202 cluster bacterium]|jgi:hypothetical protein|nr:DUF1801 domain-containing protein [SAR202 cluster bacterium]MDP6511798.1 DUF1801 domain-containing protein [SAR202 cluster bacterium]MDP6713747.1 DUF1801 domain-containing protein [SAR202 cluster bacterium]
MARSNAETVDAYLAELDPDRRDAMSEVRNIILDRLPEGYQEAMQHGMISYVIPLETYPKTYNKQPLQFAALASQKNYMSLYLMNVYGDEDTERWFVDEYKKSGKRLDMGKSCVRFKKLDDLPMELIGDAIARTPMATFLERYEAVKGK